MSSVLRVAWFDLKSEFSPPIPILLQWATFGLQLLVFGALISRLVLRIPGYLQFYAVGYIVILVFDVAISAGRRFVEQGHSGRLAYLLSLPLPRWKLFLATALQGGIWLAATVSLPLAVTLAMISDLSVVAVSAALATLFLLGFAASALMLSLSFVIFRSEDAYLATVAAMDTYLIRFSTILYPFLFLPALYAVLALFSPLTYGADLLRLFLGITVGSPLDPRSEIGVLTILFLCTMLLGLYLMEHLLEGVKSG